MLTRFLLSLTANAPALSLQRGFGEQCHETRRDGGAEIWGASLALCYNGGATALWVFSYTSIQVSAHRLEDRISACRLPF